jgi:hypothetical protein
MKIWEVCFVITFLLCIVFDVFCLTFFPAEQWNFEGK